MLWYPNMRETNCWLIICSSGRVFSCLYLASSISHVQNGRLIYFVSNNSQRLNASNFASFYIPIRFCIRPQFYLLKYKKPIMTTSVAYSSLTTYFYKKLIRHTCGFLQIITRHVHTQKWWYKIGNILRLRCQMSSFTNNFNIFQVWIRCYCHV